MTMPAPRSVSPLSASDLADMRRRLEETREFHLSHLDLDADADDIAMAMARRSEASLELVDAALERIDSGTYGVCRVCEGAISAERLDAVAHAEVCARCAGGAR